MKNKAPNKPQAEHSRKPSGKSNQRRSSRPNNRRRENRPVSGQIWLFGHHAVAAALRNPRRTCHQLLASEEGMQRLGADVSRKGIRITPTPAPEISRHLPRGAVHQGLALHVAPMPPLTLDRVIAIQKPQSLFLALDQVTDPRNFGAILRTAAAMGVSAVIVPERRSAELNGAAAKAASGALDMIPIVEVVNLTRALVKLKEAGFQITGLDSESETTIDKALPSNRRVLVVGSEGTGIRRLVGETCDEILSIDIESKIESLNVSVAASIALYALTRSA